MKKITAFLIFLFFIQIQPISAQHNPYLDRKAKNKPSAIQARKNKKDMKRQDRRARKQLKRSKRHINRKRN